MCTHTHVSRVLKTLSRACTFHHLPSSFIWSQLSFWKSSLTQCLHSSLLSCCSNYCYQAPTAPLTPWAMVRAESIGTFPDLSFIGTLLHNTCANQFCLLKTSFGSHDFPLPWLTTYLSDCFFCLHCYIIHSLFHILNVGIFECSVLSPHRFSLVYTLPLGSLILRTPRTPSSQASWLSSTPMYLTVYWISPPSLSPILRVPNQAHHLPKSSSLKLWN